MELLLLYLGVGEASATSLLNNFGSSLVIVRWRADGSSFVVLWRRAAGLQIRRPPVARWWAPASSFSGGTQVALASSSSGGAQVRASFMSSGGVQVRSSFASTSARSIVSRW